MFNFKQFRDLIVIPTLKKLEMYSEDAVNLIIATIAQESLGGTYLAQLKGPALGIIQMEPDTFKTVLNYINKTTGLADKIKSVCQCELELGNLINNLMFNVAICRINYLYRLTRTVKTEVLPSAKDFNAVWTVYKKHWNTEAGSAKVYDFTKNYKLFVNH